MPKYRKLHVASIHSLDIADMPDDFHRLMWTWLPLISCAEGRGLDMGGWLRSQIFPLRDDVSADMCNAAMEWFAQRGMVTRYTVNGRRYYQITNWHKYQGDTGRESDTIWPAPVQELVETVTQDYSRVGHELVTRKSRSQGDANTNTQGDANARATTTSRSRPSRSRPPDASPPPPLTDFPQDPEERRAEAQMIDALAQVTGMDGKLNFAALLPVARDLRSVGYTPEDLRRHYVKGASPGKWNWYLEDWRGKKGDKPTPKNITETISGAVKAPTDKPEGGVLWLDHAKVFDS